MSRLWKEHLANKLCAQISSHLHITLCLGLRLATGHGTSGVWPLNRLQVEADLFMPLLRFW